ncbi:prepilin-type N-terminal cleavage/methylation domain-containing protein [Candidatus Saccharibacteria bacterium]|nr:prepilin-type N-terminal cleavage/methylation domain-containing protein [Candidatus Saccharibacteria bacterium]MCB9821239.1 prepilin-type N-terminal cleavage/methylation domain-containing protein [Candidatus Nomurabacteria bacterium]
MKHLSQKGFTILELMIASSIFSVMLIVCLGAIVYLGKLYYKGVTISNTAEVTRASIDEITEAIQYSGDAFEAAPADPTPSGWTGAYCIGVKKYSYRIGYQLVIGTPGTNQANQVLTVSNDQSCIGYEPSGDQQRELLKENMRLTDFAITPGPSGLTNVEIGVAYGGDPTDQSVEDNTFNTEADGTIISCKDSSTGSAFCATNFLKTSALRKVGL